MPIGTLIYTVVLLLGCTVGLLVSLNMIHAELKIRWGLLQDKGLENSDA